MALAIRDRREYEGCEIVIERPDGSRVTGLAHANPIWDESGELIGAVNVVVDITDRKRMEDALRAADRQKDQFLAMLAHELRNPLAPILNAATVLRHCAPDNGNVQHQRTIIERNARHLTRMVDDLLEVSRITEGKIELRKERMELQPIVEQAVNSVQHQIEARGHSLSVSVPLHPVYLEGDPVRLTQILVNLLDNSAKYTDGGGELTVLVSHHGQEVVISVRDNGRGIEPNEAAAIFELFVQGDRGLDRTEGGLGIGLTLVKRLVELHGGRISVQSDGRNRGAEFSVRLPAEPARRSRNSFPAVGAPIREAVSPGRRILLVEDNRDAAETLAELLELWGHTVRIAFDGATALEASPHYEPDVVLLDLGLPGLNGYEVARRLRSEGTAPTLLIALTGYGDSASRSRAEEAGFHYHLTKPVDLHSLHSLLTTSP